MGNVEENIVSITEGEQVPLLLDEENINLFEEVDSEISVPSPEIEDSRFETMTIAECQVETYRHIENVRKYIKFFTDRLTARGVEHDRLKIKSPEVEIFTEYTPKLSRATYDSDEYHEFLKEMDVALQHHYANYRHHPEHFTKGINDMNLIDIVEMLCDWKAASMRQHDGNLLKSIETNAQRFGVSGQLKQIFINTAKLFDEQD